MALKYRLPSNLLLHYTVKKNYENWSTSNKVLPFGARGSGSYDSPCRMVGLSGRERSLTISSAVWIQ